MNYETYQDLRDAQFSDWKSRASTLSNYFERLSEQKDYNAMCDAIDSESTQYE